MFTTIVIIAASASLPLLVLFLALSQRNNNGKPLGKNFAIIDAGVGWDNQTTYFGYNDTGFYRMFGIRNCSPCTPRCMTIQMCKDQIKMQREENARIAVAFQIDEYVVR